MKYNVYVNEETGKRMVDITPEREGEQNFSVYTTEVLKDVNNEEFINLPNYRDKNDFSFVGKLHDAINEIQNGDGDAIHGDAYSVNVVRYMNRDYGKYIRDFYLKEYENTTLCYGVVLNVPKLFAPDFMTKDFHVIYSDPNLDAKPVEFNSEAEAYEFIQSFHNQVVKFKEAKENIIKNTSDLIQRHIELDELIEKTNKTVVTYATTFQQYQYLEVVQMSRD